MAEPSSSRLYLVFVLLLMLLAATIAVAQIHLGAGNLAVATLIASIKALLIMLYFMHVRYSSRLIWLVAGAGFFWLGIMIALTLSDYLSRGWTDFSA